MAATPRLSIVTIDPNRYPEVNFELVRELSNEELTEYAKAKGVLSRFMEDQQKIKLLRETYDEYKSVVEAEARRLEVRERPLPVSEVHMQDLRALHQVNGRVRGLLSEIATFLNYAEGYLKREYGHDSEQVKFYKARTHKEYDASPSYRFVYELRNYAIHRDVPINGMIVEDGDLDPETGIVKKIVRVEIARDGLLNSGYNWRKVRPDIEAFPSRFPIDPHLEHMMAAIGRIGVAVIVAMLPDMKRSARYILDLIQPLMPRLQGKQGSPVIVHWDAPPASVKVGQSVRMEAKTDMIPADLATSVLGMPEPNILAKVIDEV